MRFRINNSSQSRADRSAASRLPGYQTSGAVPYSQPRCRKM